MSEFIHSEASVSSDEGSDAEVDNLNSDDENENDLRHSKKKFKSKNISRIRDDDEEESEDEEKKEKEDDDDDGSGSEKGIKSKKSSRFIVDDEEVEYSDMEHNEKEKNSNDENEEDGENIEKPKKKRSREKNDDEDSDEDKLDDEDYDLLEENLGTKVERTQKRRRIKIASDDEDEDDNFEAGLGTGDKEILGNELFDGDNEPAPSVSRESVRDRMDLLEDDLENSEEESEEDVNDFIVDDDDHPIAGVKKKKKRVHDDIAMQEAYDIFGANLDLSEFADYAEDDEDEDEDYEQDAEEDDIDGEAPRPIKQKKKRAKLTISQIYEPSELEKGHFTDYDQEIRMADMPERFQLRYIAICPTEEGELEEESEWIYNYAFNVPPISKQEYFENEPSFNSTNRKGPSTINKIREALNLMRNQKFEVPFIAFYRKEYIDPELNITDLWKVYHWDEKWMQLRTRKKNLVRLLEQMQQFQYELINRNPDKPLDGSFRRLSEEDIERVKAVQTMEQLSDVHQHFMLYYCNDVSKMKQFASQAKKKQKQKDLEENPSHEDNLADEDDQETLKHATRKSGYNICVDAGLIDVAKRFGLTPEQFGENMRDNYQRYEVEQDPAEPNELAEEFIKGQFSTVENVLAGARHIVAMQIAHDPLVRNCVRQIFYERCKLNVKPTKKGIKEIDESHACYTFKYLKNKPVQDLIEDQFLKITQAETDGLLIVEILIEELVNSRYSYLEEIKPLYHRDEFSNLVQEWNKQRGLTLERALNTILYPIFVKEIKVKLVEEAKESIVKACCRKLYNWLKVAPFQVDQPLEEDDEDFDTSHGLRVMGIAYTSARDEASFCAVIDGDGEVTDFLRLPYLSKRKNAWNKDDRELKEKEMEKIRDFIISKKPHVIAVGAESRDVLNTIEDIKGVVAELEQEHQIASINIELVDNELAQVYSSTKKSEHDLREYPVLLRQAVSLARRLQDPLVEFSQLCNSDEDILSLRFHSMQELINKDILLNNLYLEFVNRVNEVGVDVSRCIAHPHTSALIQFVCGLGPRKGYHLLKTLKQHNSRLENRTQLVTHVHVGMGPKVFINCAGFVKIDTSAVVDGTDTYVEVLDGSRIHPETYEWARKMAVDALEYDDTTADANPAGALEEILESPDRLKDLDLDAFAEELERQGYGDKHITLYDIRAELNHRYKDLRTPYRSPTVEERFNLLTKETPHTFYIGKLITCKVTGIAYKRPQGEQLEVANPVRNDVTGLWQCPFCQKDDFPELSEVWNHFDAAGCPGQAVGVRTRLDNSVSGFLSLKFISDKHVSHPEDRVKIGMVVNCRITKIDIDKFQVDLTSRSSDLLDANHKWRISFDHYYDVLAEDNDTKKEEDKKKQQTRQSYIKRVIAHPSFQNIDFKTCGRLMDKLEQGEVIIRPSSKGADHLTLTWKVAEGIMQHIDIREEGKVNAFSLGKSLWIDTESFEDLDEIIARYIQPMAALARDVLNYRYFKELDQQNMDKHDIVNREMATEKQQNNSKIPYYFSISKKYPGKFILSYLPAVSPRHEYITVIPDGLKYRGQVFQHLSGLIKWFKEHFREPFIGMSHRTPMFNTPSQIIPPSNNIFNGSVRPSNTPSLTPGYVAPYQQAPVPSPVLTPLLTPGGHQAPYNANSVQQGTPRYNLTPHNQQWTAAVGYSNQQQNTNYSPAINNQISNQPPIVMGPPNFIPHNNNNTNIYQPRVTSSDINNAKMNPITPINHFDSTPRNINRSIEQVENNFDNLRTGMHNIKNNRNNITSLEDNKQHRGGAINPSALPNQAQDWAKAAQLWMKNKTNNSNDYQGRNTPVTRNTQGANAPILNRIQGNEHRHKGVSASPYVGDTTPLIDEN